VRQRAFWLVAYPSQGHEMLFDAHTRCFAALGGVARRGIYDNMKTAVDKVKKGKGRLVNARFATMCAHYLFDPDFCNVASGWEKGVVEKNVQDSRRRIWIDAAKQRFGSFAELNAWLGRGAGRCGTRCATPSTSSSAWPRCWSTSGAPDAHAGAVRRLRREARAGVQHLPGEVARNRYSVPCELAGQMVSTRLYPGTEVAVVAGDAHRGQPRAAEQRRRDAL
jgi:hypothetical protein